MQPAGQRRRAELRRLTAAASSLLFGTATEPLRVGRFVIERKIGAGALGTVYAARDPSLDRVVALKVLRREHEKLIGEARAMARLQHPNVVYVHEVGVVDDGGARVFLAMELVSGGTLRAWLAQEERAWRDILDVLVQAARGLSAAHAAGLVHRDFKPENVLVGADGRARVTDFGLALLDDTGGTGDGAGTPAYMAPEQHERAAVGAAADQYAFCVTAWEALAGARPFAHAGSGGDALKG